MTSSALPHPSTVTRIRFDTILFATDFSEASRHAQGYAVALATLFGARLVALHIEIPPESIMPYADAAPDLAHALRTVRETQMRELERSLAGRPVPFKCVLGTGDVKDKISEIINQYSIDLVVLGTHARQGADFTLFGSTAEDVFRSVNCPVLTVGPRCEPCASNRPIGHIVYAADFTPGSETAALYAMSLAQEFHSGLTVMHVLPEGTYSAEEGERLKRFAFDKLRTLVPESNCDWCSVEYVVAQGESVERVLEVAGERRADLIILGLHDSVTFMSHLPMRAAYRMICRATCPVMTILPRHLYS